MNRTLSIQPATVRLDASQKRFCQAPERNVRLIAPAGCGKTLSLLYRCRHLAAQRQETKQRFLVLTFTRAARDELLDRLQTAPEFAHLRDQVEITTLNSWGWRRVRNVAFSPKLLTSKPDFHFTMKNQLQPVWQNHARIRYAISERKSWRKNQAPQILMRTLDEFKSLGFDHVRQTDFASFSEHWNAVEAIGLGWRMNDLIDELTKIEVFEDGGSPEKREVDDLRKRVYNDFFCFWIGATQHLSKSSMFTLEDQKYFAFQDELRNIEEGSRLSGAASYDHIFVDEFQDINPLDLGLIRAIVERNRASVTIAGDDDQAIFEWRGATPEYILAPEAHLNVDFSTYILAVNYRSPRNIVEHSQCLIDHNTRRVPKEIRADNPAEATIRVVDVGNLTEALNFVDEIVGTSGMASRTPTARIALISRKRSQIIPYQIFFASKELPFYAAEDLQLFLSAAFDRLLELLTIKASSSDRLRTARIVKDMIYLCDLIKRYPLSKANRESVRRHLQNARPASFEAATTALADYRGDLKGKNPGGSVSMAMAEAVREFLESETVSSTLIALSNTFEGLHQDFGKSEDDIFYVDPPFFQLAEYATRYGKDYEGFVEDVELAKSTLVRVPPEDEGVDESLRRPLHLMTALRAKGKEFDKVVLLDVEDGMWPNKNAKTPAQLEQERRVFYVGFTRARREITLLLNRSATPSPYIQELGLAARDPV